MGQYIIKVITNPHPISILPTSVKFETGAMTGYFSLIVAWYLLDFKGTELKKVLELFVATPPSYMFNSRGIMANVGDAENGLQRFSTSLYNKMDIFTIVHFEKKIIL